MHTYTLQNFRHKIFSIALIFLLLGTLFFTGISSSFAEKASCINPVCTQSETDKGLTYTPNDEQKQDGEEDAKNADQQQTDKKIYLREPLPGQSSEIDVSTSKGSINILSEWIGHVFKFIAAVSVIIAILVMMFAGFQLMFSEGDSGAKETAKEMIQKVMMGIALLFMAGLILNFVNPKFYIFNGESISQDVTEDQKAENEHLEDYKQAMKLNNGGKEATAEQIASEIKAYREYIKNNK